MCGLVGIFDPKQGYGKSHVDQAINSISYRGIDERGVVDAAEHSPIEHHDGVVRTAAQMRGRVSNGAARAEGFVLDGIGDLDPEVMSVAELLGEDIGAV